MKNVSAAIIKKGSNGLLTRRAPGEKLAGFWKFPGGKRDDVKQIAVFNTKQLTETSIVAPSADSRISINRVSGMMLEQTNGIESQAVCELSSKQRF
jgi:hypothetical protein